MTCGKLRGKQSSVVVSSAQSSASWHCTLLMNLGDSLSPAHHIQRLPGFPGSSLPRAHVTSCPFVSQGSSDVLDSVGVPARYLGFSDVLLETRQGCGLRSPRKVPSCGCRHTAAICTDLFPGGLAPTPTLWPSLCPWEGCHPLGHIWGQTSHCP